MGLAALVATTIPAGAVDLGATGQLQPGQQKGKFAFSYSSKIKFVQEEAFPVRVILCTDKQVTVAEVTVLDGAEFTITADLPPGGYQIRSDVMPAKQNVYWSAAGSSFFINSEGGIRYLPVEDSLVHLKKLQMLTPNSQHQASTRRSDMVVRWAPFRGAVRYHLSWAEQTLSEYEKLDSGAEDTSNQEFTFPVEVHVNRRYEFAVYAFDGSDRKMGCSEPFYIYTSGAKKVKEPKVASAPSAPNESIALIGPDKPSAPQAPEKTATRVPPAPFFGVRPKPVAGVGADGRGGLLVDGIGFNSPASRAGLKQNDVITNFNGVPLSQATTVDEFTALVRNITPGTKVPIEFYRKNVRMVAEVTIELKR